MSALLERVAQILAHRACCGVEHDPSNGKLHGFCVVCGVPWPCAYAGPPQDVVSDPIVDAPEALGPVEHGACDCCSEMVPLDDLSDLIAYGIETTACDTCRGIES